MSEWITSKQTGKPMEVAVFGDKNGYLAFDVTDDWPKMPEPEEVARWEAAWRERLAAEARERAA